MTTILTETGGKFSAIRVIVLLSFTVTLGVWAFMSLSMGALLPLPESLVTLNGLAIGGKTVQRFGEK